MATKSDVGNSVKSPPKKARGRPFKPGNPYRFKPGQSGNPSGRPKLLGMSYAKILAMETENGKTVAEECAEAMADSVIEDRNVAAAREMRKATEGDRVALELTGKDGGPIELIWPESNGDEG